MEKLKLITKKKENFIIIKKLTLNWFYNKIKKIRITQLKTIK